jgi:hypothetical protein
MGNHAQAAAEAQARVHRTPDALRAYVEAAQLLVRCAAVADLDASAMEDSGLPPSPDPLVTPSEQYRDAARRILDDSATATMIHPVWEPELAWLLATCSDHSLRDPPRALDIARRLGRGNMQNAELMLKVGAASLACGKYDAAIGAAKMADQASGGELHAHLIIWALAEGRRGNLEEAQRWYAKALDRRARMHRTYQEDDGIKALYAEAAELLDSAQ